MLGNNKLIKEIYGGKIKNVYDKYQFEIIIMYILISFTMLTIIYAIYSAIFDETDYYKFLEQMY
jgi:hypothetical protein